MNFLIYLNLLIFSGKDHLWRMPLHKDYYDMIKAEHCDLKNIGGPWGGSCTAAAFLQQFVEKDVKWAHIDIAGVGGGMPDNQATGFGVSLLFDYFSKNLWLMIYLIEYLS